MATSIHLTNAKGRNATVALAGVKPIPPPKLGLPGATLVFRKYIAAAETGTHAALQEKFGQDYAQQLITSDPEVDLEVIGSTVEDTQTVYLDGEGKVMFVDPKFLELIINADGTEKERREPLETIANVNTELPVRWSGRKILLAEAVKRFAFRRRMQLRHTDGLSYDYLYEIARDLETAQAVMLLGSGEKGTGPLIFQSNGRAYRGFLEGRTQGKSYQLMLLLSDMELKQPVAPAGKDKDGE